MISLLLSTILVINELMAANVGDVMSPATNFDSWIELYNPSNEDIDLKGMYLSNDVKNLTLWKIPSGVGVVPAKGYKVIWLGSEDIDYNQAPFKLDCDGGTICLSDASGSLLISEDYPQAISHTSYARKTDGGEEWGWTNDATPGESNAKAKFTDQRLDAPKISVDSKLFTGSFDVSVTIPAGAHLMYTTDGRLPSAPAVPGEEVSPWKEYVVNGNCEGTQTTSLSYRNADGSKDLSDITEGVGVDGSRGIKVHSSSTAQNDHDAQFFIYTPDHIWHTGERYRFKMKVRADKEAKIQAQTHTTPHNYIFYQMFDGKSFTVTSEWKEFSYEGTITDDQVGKQGGGWSWWGTEPITYKNMQTIAFNLNIDRIDNNFYFDEVSWEYDITSGDTDTTAESTDGKFTIKETTNLTVRLYQDGYLPSVPVTRSYIKTTQEYTCPVVSIVGDQRFFTDPMWGIDVEGMNGVEGNGRNDPVNWNQPWDRPVNFSFITPDGKMAFNQDANISVSGGWTRMIDPRSMKLKANKKFDGQNRFDYSFFPEKPYIRNKAILLRNGGNDVWETHSRFMDLALESIITRSGIDLDAQTYLQVAEFINGQFKGIVNMRETNNDKFVDANFGYDDDEIDYFENFDWKIGDEDVWDRIVKLSGQINDAGAYDELQKLLDIDVFCNYMAVELFLGNNDWPDNNIKAFRSRNDGRYRFISFDLDYAFKRENSFSELSKFKSIPAIKVFNNLLGHDEFRKKYIDTFCLIAGSVFEKDRATAIVNEIADAMRPMSQLDGYTPDGAADRIKTKLKTWQDKMTKNLEKYELMNLSGVTRQNVELKADVEGARIFVDEIEVPYAYLKGYLYAPVKLRAQAPAGYRFKGWNDGNGITSTEATINLPAGNVTLTATFEKASEGIPSVRVNEVSAANGIFVNEFFKRDDWVELYNTTDADIDVEGMYLSDDPLKPKKHQISKENTLASTVIPAHGYLIIWCDKQDPLSQLHASFKLSAEGGDVLLTSADGSWSDKLAYPLLKADETAIRWPDGCNDVFKSTVPTIAKSNKRKSYMTVVDQSGTSGINDAMADGDNSLTATYSTGSLLISGAASDQVQVVVHNLAGQTIMSLSLPLTGGYADVSLSSLSSGVYVATVTDTKGHKTNCKFIQP